MLDTINNFLWGYCIIILLGIGAFYFTVKGGFLQFRFLNEMIRLLTVSNIHDKKEKGKHISSFQAFVVAMASRVGTGNLAGVASAIFVGGPGAVFWMWIMALLGSATAFVESTLAQLFKVHGKHSFIGGPAYYMLYGLHRRWMGVIFAVLITLTFGFANTSVQSNTICGAMSHAFNWSPLYIGIIMTLVCLFIFFGGIQYIARVSSVLVPFMAVGYVLLAIYVISSQYQEIPHVLKTIVESAFGFDQALGGGIGIAVIQGVKRGLFSNEAGEGSTPNVAATATVSHPVSQGFIQALGVFTDTLLICTCTAFIILCCGPALYSGYDGIQLTQFALSSEIGSSGDVIIAIAILFFAFSSILGNYYYGEANIQFITRKTWVLSVYRIFVGAWVLWGSITTLENVWRVTDLMMAFLVLCNIIAIFELSKYTFILLKDYSKQKREGIKNPVFSKKIFPKKIQEDIHGWD